MIELNEHQQKAVEEITRKPHGVILRAPVGAGKTRVALELARRWHEKGRPVAYISTSRIAYEEMPKQAAELVPELPIHHAQDRVTRAARIARWKNEGGVLAISIQSAHHIGTPPENLFLILDESTLVKNPGGEWQATIGTLADAAAYRLVMTGTLTSNSLNQVYGQAVAALGPTVTLKLLGTIDSWYRRHFVPEVQFIAGRRIVTWHPQVGAEERIAEELANFTVLMNAQPIRLPEVKVHLIPAGHWEPESDVYTTRLQESLGLLYAESGMVQVLHTYKLDAIEALAKRLHNEGRPFIYVYRFIHERDEIQRRLKALGLKTATTRSKRWMQRWRDRELDAVLLHPRSAGHGLNLQAGGADIIWGQPTGDREDWEQTVGRLARAGQPEPMVHVWVPVTTGDDRLYIERVAARQKLEGRVVQHIIEEKMSNA